MANHRKGIPNLNFNASFKIGIQYIFIDAITIKHTTQGGTYTFYLTSDDSRLYIYDTSVEVEYIVNNMVSCTRE